jgi:hypothetical protein
MRSRPEMAQLPILNSGAVGRMIQASEEQRDARQHRQGQAHHARARLLRHRQLGGEDGDEDDVVDAEHQLEQRQGRQGDPYLRIENPLHAPPPAVGVHMAISTRLGKPNPLTARRARR